MQYICTKRTLLYQIFCNPQRIPAIVQAFNDNNVSFVVRGGLQVLVMLADPNAGTVHSDATCI